MASCRSPPLPLLLIHEIKKYFFGETVLFKQKNFRLCMPVILNKARLIRTIILMISLEKNIRTCFFLTFFMISGGL